MEAEEKTVTLWQKEVSFMKRSLVPVKGFIKNISPFNSKDDMPSALLITKKLLAFFLCYLAGIFLAEGLVIGGLFLCGRNFLKGEMFSDNVMMLLKLYGMIILIAVCILYWKLVVKRKLNEIGITKNISGWFMGAGMGVVLIITAVSAIMVTGTIEFSGFSANFNITMLLMLGGYTVQGAAEELLSRGLVFCSLKDKVSLPAAVGASADAFALPHMGTLCSFEAEYIFPGVLCLILISCVFSLLTLRTKSIWAACGLHSMWNFCLSCILGLDLSGSEGSCAVINMRTSGKNLFNGGRYGIEASIITAAVLAAAAVLLWHMYKRNNTERQA